MPSGVYVLKNVPTDQLPFVVASYKAQGAEVTTTPEPDGEWTVTAVFPEAPGGGAASVAGKKVSGSGGASRKKTSRKRAKKKSAKRSGKKKSGKKAGRKKKAGRG